MFISHLQYVKYQCLRGASSFTQAASKSLWLAATILWKRCRQNGSEKYAPCFTYFKSQSDVRLLKRMQWNIGFIQVLCLSGEWRSAVVFIPRQEIDTNTVVGSDCYFMFCARLLCFCCSFCLHQCKTDRGKTLRSSVSFRPACLRLQLGHITTLRTWLKVMPPGLRWAQISVCQKCNWRKLKIHPSQWGQIAPRCPARWGPLTERMNTIEGLFLAERA